MRHFQESLKEDYIKALPEKLGQFSDFLGDNPWFAGANISYVDFHMYEQFDQHRILAPEVIGSFPKIVDFLNRFEALPAIKAYMKSDRLIKHFISLVRTTVVNPLYYNRFMRSPLNNKMAIFGNK